jgi:uncharacterized protein YegL
MARRPGIEDSLGLGHLARPSANGTAARLPLVLALDTSNSINKSGRLGELNSALREWVTQLKRQDLGAGVDLALITFGAGGVEVVSLRPDGPGGFEPVHDIEAPPPLRAGGSTPLGEAIGRAIGLCESHVAALQDGGQHVHRPNIWIVTDGRPTDERGHPTDDWRRVLPDLRAAESGNRLLVFAIGLHGADASVLAEVAPDSHFPSPSLSIADALNIASISSSATIGAHGQAAKVAYERVRDLFRIVPGGDLR